MNELLKRIPTKHLITIVLCVLVFLSVLIGYAVIFQRTQVEILGIVKFGESTEDLQKRLVKLQAESDSKISAEAHKKVLDRLKEAESKAAQPSPDSGKLKSQLKERDDRIAELLKQLTEAKRTNDTFTKELADAKSKVEIVNVELQRSEQRFSETSRQLKEQTKKMDDLVSVANERQKTLSGYVHQFEDLERRSGKTSDDYIEQNYVKQYNEVLNALKKELPSDNYVKNAEPLSIYGSRHTFSSNLISATSRMRAYLQQRYLK